MGARAKTAVYLGVFFLALGLVRVFTAHADTPQTLTLGWRAVPNTAHYVVKWNTTTVFRPTTNTLTTTVTGAEVSLEIDSVLTGGSAVLISSSVLSASSPPVCTRTDNTLCNWPASPEITGAASNPWTGNDILTSDATYHQTLSANDQSHWNVTANANTSWGGVQGFPNSGFNMGGTVDSKASTTSSWNVTLPTDNTKVAAWSGYDLWFNNWADEVFVVTDEIVPAGIYDCTSINSTTINGQAWHECRFGSERVLKPGTDDAHLINMPTGTIDVKVMLQYLESIGQLPANSAWTAASAGFEVDDTHGTNQVFTYNDWTWNAS